MHGTIGGMIPTVIQTGSGASTGGGELMWISTGLHLTRKRIYLGGGSCGTGFTGDIGTGGQPISHTSAKNVAIATSRS